MLKVVFRSLVWLLALIGAFSVGRTLCWPTSATLYESDGWLVVVAHGRAGDCVAMDRNGAPIADFLLETNSDSGRVVSKTDPTGRAVLISADPPSATVLLPTGHRVRPSDLGLIVFIKK